MCFTIFQKQNTPFQTQKTKVQKLKKWTFPKGLVHGFGQKSAIFPPFNFRQNRAEKCVLRYSRRKNAFLDYKDKKFTKSKNQDYSIGVSPWLLSKNGSFSIFFHFRQNRPGKCFSRYSRKKNAFRDYKNKKFKESKNWDFYRRLVHGFCQNWQLFPVFFFIFGKINQKNEFHGILERKSAFLDPKKNKFKKINKNWDFFEEVNPWFWSKIGNFSFFLFQAKKARKMCLTVFLKEKTPFQFIKTRN